MALPLAPRFRAPARRTRLVPLAALALGLGLLAPALPPAVGVAVAQDTATPAADLSAERMRLGARFAELVGANELYISALNAQRRDIIRLLASTNPDIVEVVTEVTDLAYVEMVDTTAPLFEQIAAIYGGAYTEEELTELVAFLEGDLGQKFLASRRPTDEAALQATFAWGDSINSVFLARVRALLTERGIQL